MTAEKQEQVVSEITSRVAVVRVDRHFRVAAAQQIHACDALFELNGDVYPNPTRFSIQLGLDEHIDAPPETAAEDGLDLYPWRCLNHSCDPNARFQDRTLVAIHDIAPWEQITFDYNTTEFDMATPFPCSCGAEECLGLIRGFRYLSFSERQKRLPYFATYLHVFLSSLT